MVTSEGWTRARLINVFLEIIIFHKTLVKIVEGAFGYNQRHFFNLCSTGFFGKAGVKTDHINFL